MSRIASGAADVIVYGYDTRGRVTTRNNQTFTVDLADRVTRIVGKNPTTYRYDGHGHRTMVTKGATTTVQVYSQAGQLLYQRAPSTNDGIFRNGPSIHAVMVHASRCMSMKIGALLLTISTVVASCMLAACGANKPRRDCVAIGVVVGAPHGFDGRRICAKGYAIVDRHNLQIVEAKDSQVSIVLDIAKDAEQSPMVRRFIQLVYRDPLSKPWRDVYASFNGTFRFSPAEIPRYFFSVDDVVDVEDQSDSEGR